LFVRPFRLIARGLFEIVDRLIIDTVAVNGAAFAVGLFGRIARWFQNGQVQRYLAGVVIGAAAVFLITDCHHKPSFECRMEGDRVVLRAEPGGGITKNAILHWDLDGDGKPDIDAKPGELELPPRPIGDIGAEVTLWIDDPSSGKTTSVSRMVRLVDGNALECE
jgi:hypothetical protein